MQIPVQQGQQATRFPSESNIILPGGQGKKGDRAWLRAIASNFFSEVSKFSLTPIIKHFGMVQNRVTVVGLSRYRGGPIAPTSVPSPLRIYAGSIPPPQKNVHPGFIILNFPSTDNVARKENRDGKIT